MVQMKRERLVRDVKREALFRMEDAARTEEDFKRITIQWDHLDANRERRERYHEIGRDRDKIELGYKDGAVIPSPTSYTYWREVMKGDFISVIYDNPDEMWEIIEDFDVASMVKGLTAKQKEVLFSSAVRLCPTEQIAICKEKTGRAIRKLLAATRKGVRNKLAARVRARIESGQSVTYAMREFLKWYGISDYIQERT
jgi:hypothetical protein